MAMTAVASRAAAGRPAAKAALSALAPRRRAAAAALTTAAGKQVVSTADAPAALGPYSQAVRAGNMLFVSGQLGLVPGQKELPPTVEAQTEQAMKNMGAILKAAGGDYGAVVKTTILLADMADFAAVNAVYGAYFPKDPPARATFAVKTLPLNARVEIEAVAMLQ
jgi:2-iminobutanoate/2-iminopropanoate deaminase